VRIVSLKVSEIEYQRIHTQAQMDNLSHAQLLRRALRKYGIDMKEHSDKMKVKIHAET
jgi:hypothetical protein